MKPVVFYTKCRPGLDAWEIAQKYSIAFIGYPPWKPGKSVAIDGRTGYAEALFNIVEESNCAGLLIDVPVAYRKQVTANANMARQIGAGSYVIVPRPQDGVCYIGEVTSSFDLVDAPEWADDYVQMLRLKNKLAEDCPGDKVSWYLGDLVQVWHVKEWKTLAFPLLPRWISYRMMSRNTFGVIYDFKDVDLFAHERVRQLLDETTPLRSARDGIDLIETQLLEWVSPTMFEHLVVDLLQLEAGNTIGWHHVGGSGDGGVDGIGLSPDRNVVGIVQCKWLFDHRAGSLLKDMAEIRDKWPTCQVVLAVLIGPDTLVGLPPWVRYLGRKEIAAHVDKYRNQLPLAWTIGLHKKDVGQ